MNEVPMKAKPSISVWPSSYVPLWDHPTYAEIPPCQLPHNFDDFVSSSPRPLSIFPGEIQDHIVFPVGSSGKEILKFEPDVAYDYSDSLQKQLWGAFVSSSELNDYGKNPFLNIFNVKSEMMGSSSAICGPDQHELLHGEDNVPLIEYPILKACRTSTKVFSDEDDQMIAQDDPLIEKHPVETRIPGYEHHSGRSLLSLPSGKCGSKRSREKDRLQRARIADGLNNLHKIVPNSGKATQETILGDVVDHVKILKLQVKGLSQSRLCSEAITDPLIYIEGSGHFLPHEKITSKSLEERIGHLLESNMQAVMQLLEGRGLTLMPISFADSL
ncbi:hypothetical protein QJS10_CPA16g01372 [Acorus calamus]|uniref:BHLH domain-containing protein n=1 Tax=Acorus calamus TaxID=4465 RepID=A0AAV9D1P0_ACOCL|nr:hypothetical protein QJS10_CPA16g01372 [Acorus calamus]